ncbi:hypothetical protein MVEN_01307500 [Mycena venus]|uniref:DUF6699 domain-containing protein n=1 Tax=Mycena venus TaxID=2733690 RepID=A0A8H6XXH7_9AGAR|nr:hypothetical protein MVEN_01307500 [Mycena venus]
MAACRTMSLKEVHWKLTVEEYAARDSPESWTSPLPSPETSPVSISSRRSTPTPPPPPQPTQNLPLPTTLEIHPTLTPANALQLDLSFPSDAFRRNPQLTASILAAPACTPPRTAICVRIAAGLYKARVQVRHSARDSGDAQDAVTVGDILTTLQRELRQYDGGATPADAEPYMRRRIATVNGYSERRSAEVRAATVAAESDGGGRMVDHLLGHTMFAGLTLQQGQPDHCWQLELSIPDRHYTFSLCASLHNPTCCII